jgi:hypothetical protein
MELSRFYGSDGGQTASESWLLRSKVLRSTIVKGVPHRASPAWMLRYSSKGLGEMRYCSRKSASCWLLRLPEYSLISSKKITPCCSTELHEKKGKNLTLISIKLVVPGF